MHHKPAPLPWVYQKYGKFKRKKPPFIVQRYLCKTCGRTFSDQTFKPTYWMKYPEHLPQILKQAVTGAANSQIARTIRCASSTVDTQLERLGRHAMLFHEHMMRKASPFVDIVVDGLVTFEHSQYYPFEVLTAVDKQTSFFIHFTDAPLRRSGRMTEYQKERRKHLESVHLKPDPKAVEKGMAEVLERSLEGAIRAHVWSDRHRAYPRAIRRAEICEIVHDTWDSRLKRDRWNPLFEINLLDMLLRHCLKDHTRETIAFSKRRNNSLYRVAIMLVWRNYINLRRQKRCRETPAQLAGVTGRRWREEEILGRRLFVTHFSLPESWNDIYWRRVETAPREVNRRHALKYAF